MGLGDFHRQRRFAAAFAFVGVLLYTALVPGHVLSQATAFSVTDDLLVADDLGAALEMRCHNGVTKTHAPSTPDDPTAPQKKCPFCMGYAAFMTSLAGACDAGTLEAERTTALFSVFHEEALQRVGLEPQNRGPPLEL